MFLDRNYISFIGKQNLQSHQINKILDKNNEIDSSQILLLSSWTCIFWVLETWHHILADGLICFASTTISNHIVSHLAL